MTTTEKVVLTLLILANLINYLSVSRRLRVLEDGLSWLMKRKPDNVTPFVPERLRPTRLE